MGCSIVFQRPETYMHEGRSASTEATVQNRPQPQQQSQANKNKQGEKFRALKAKEAAKKAVRIGAAVRFLNLHYPIDFYLNQITIGLDISAKTIRALKLCSFSLTFILDFLLYKWVCANCFKPCSQP